MSSTAMTCEERLCAARDALHELLLGCALVRINIKGRDIEFRQTSITNLRNYIAELERECGTNAGQRCPATLRKCGYGW